MMVIGREGNVKWVDVSILSCHYYQCSLLSKQGCLVQDELALPRVLHHLVPVHIEIKSRPRH
jgi:hypothetical protein